MVINPKKTVYVQQLLTDIPCDKNSEQGEYYVHLYFNPSRKLKVIVPIISDLVRNKREGKRTLIFLSNIILIL